MFPLGARVVVTDPEHGARGMYGYLIRTDDAARVGRMSMEGNPNLIVTVWYDQIVRAND